MEGERRVLELSVKDETWTDKATNVERHGKVLYTTIQVNGTDKQVKLQTVFKSEKYLLLSALGIVSK